MGQTFSWSYITSSSEPTNTDAPINTSFSSSETIKKISSCRLYGKLSKVDNIGTFEKTADGYRVTNHEGFVAFGIDGGAVKLNDRMEFNRLNFAATKKWAS